MLASELEVALVVEGNAHDGAGPELHEHVGSDEAGHLLAVDRVDGMDAERDALSGVPVDLRGAGPLKPVLQFLHGLRSAAHLRQAQDLRVLGCEHEERHTPQRVGPGGEHRHLVTGLGDLEDHLRPRRPPDPVALHGQNPFRPPTQLGHVLQQPVGVGGDLEEPLDQVAADHHRAAPFASTVDHLFVRQHRLVLGAPVGGGQLSIGQPGLVELEEQPLGPSVVLRVARVELPRPVEGHPVALERCPLLVDVGVRPFPGVHPPLDGRVLGRQAEGVPSDRMQHVVAPHPLVPGDGVADPEGLGVAHVQVARWVREHVQRVETRAAVVLVHGPEQALLLPHGLPLGLDLVGIVGMGLCHGASCAGFRPKQRSGLAEGRRGGSDERACIVPRPLERGWFP